MDQSPQFVKGLERGKFHTHTNNTVKLKQSMCFYSLTHTIDQSCDRAKIVQWVAESVWPFEIVMDWGFQSLMKTGCPAYYIPSPSTVSCDVQMVFSQTQKSIAKMLWVRKASCPKRRKLTINKEYDGALSFATDAWTSSIIAHLLPWQFTLHRRVYPCALC